MDTNKSLSGKSRTLNDLNEVIYRLDDLTRDLARAQQRDSEFSETVRSKIKSMGDLRAFKLRFNKIPEFHTSICIPLSDLRTRVEAEIAQEQGVQDSPKLKACWAISYERGSSSGFREVFRSFYELVELIK